MDMLLSFFGVSDSNPMPIFLVLTLISKKVLLEPTVFIVVFPKESAIVVVLKSPDNPPCNLMTQQTVSSSVKKKRA